ncbi:MAG TPA: hypothetical protein PKM43_13100, partial [Verrucomicrobiota bacterium]|nr:hypothetical protein [Verrucomicrobiota bacterium]
SGPVALPPKPEVIFAQTLNGREQDITLLNQAVRKSCKRMTLKKHNKSQPNSRATEPRPVPPPGYEQHQGEIALRMSHFLLRYLNTLYREFDGDLALVIVLGEIAHHNVCRMFSAEGPLGPLQETNYYDPALYATLEPCNAFSLAAATGIPRETVRRKIGQLVKRGWLRRDPDSSVRIRPSVGQHFRPDFNVRLLLELLEVSEELKKLLDSTPSERGHSARPMSKQ